MRNELFKRLAATGVMLAVGLLVIPGSVNASTKNTETVTGAAADISITMSTSGSVALPGLTPAERAVTSSASDTVSVSTNNSAGYTLLLADKDATSALTSADSIISAHAASGSAPTALATNAWGYALAGGLFDASYSTLNSSASSAARFAGVPASGAASVIKTTSAAEMRAKTTVWYAVKVDANKAAGIYKDTVTYTAIAN